MNHRSHDYPKQVGDIQVDHSLDDPGFKPCNENHIPQYYEFSHGLMYKGEKIKITEFFMREFRDSRDPKATGYVTIRFVVNCEGKTGRFRIQETDEQFVDRSFDKKLTGQLLNLTKKLNGWSVPSDGTRRFDYYQYLTFKLEAGRLMEILP